jgi:uncharacterized protein (TIGR03083 family)
MEHAEHVAAIRRESAALSDAARAAGPDAAVPSCPDWTVADLLGHIGRIQPWVAGLIESRPADPSENWRQHEPPAPDVRVAWFDAGASRLADALAAADPDDEVWTWAPDRRIGFWSRRMAHEVAVHRWDAQSAAHATTPIDRALAVDGIQETFDLLPLRIDAHARAGSGETIHLHCTDGDGEWLVRLTADGIEVTREHAKGDVAARGTASDLLLLTCSRIAPDAVDTFGDAALLARFQELVQF